MKRLFVLLGLLLILLPGGAALADNNTFGIAWGISFPFSDTKDFADDVSFRGLSAEWRNFYTRDMAYGINVGWNVFNETDDSTVEIDNAAFTGKRWSYINAVPIYASWFKYFSQDKRSKRVFAGLNAGTLYMERRIEVGFMGIEEDAWHFALAPEIGVQLPWDAFLGYIAARYHYAFESGDVPAQQYLEIKIGFGLD